MLLPVLFLPAALLRLSTPPPVSQSLDWVLMTVTAGHLCRPRSQLGGALLGPFPTTLSRLLWDPYPLPILSGGELPSNTLLTTHPPTLLRAEV